jgi:hypothetical protein
MKTEIFPFTSSGFTHELLEQSGQVCLVHRHKEGSQEHFEVVVLRWRKEHTWPNGKVSPAGYGYPSSEDWGTYGFTYRDEKSARNRLISLLQAQNSRFQATAA